MTRLFPIKITQIISAGDSVILYNIFAFLLPWVLKTDRRSFRMKYKPDSEPEKKPEQKIKNITTKSERSKINGSPLLLSSKQALLQYFFYLL